MQANRRIVLRLMGIVVWVSFLTASAATMVFFAMFDPQTLGQVTTWSIQLTRMEGYSIGFLLFWALTFSTATIAAFLMCLPKQKLAKPSPEAMHESRTDSLTERDIERGDEKT